jgi:phage host-nuclease inhibitor protein Gam
MTYEEMEQIAALDLTIPEQRERALAWRIEDRPTLEWAMSILARGDQEGEAIREEFRAVRARLDAKEAELLKRNENATVWIRSAAEEYARSHKKDLVVRGQTAHLVHGEISWRKSGEKVEIEDNAAALAWCIAQAHDSGLTRVKVEIDKKALSSHVLSTGEIPPGVAIVPPTETITLKPASPETIDVPAPRKELP